MKIWKGSVLKKEKYLSEAIREKLRLLKNKKVLYASAASPVAIPWLLKVMIKEIQKFI